ncbi:hypothetical protein [Nocardioides ochotonae]|uniref:hypothetical protein n=1 Tax=Nocardioides ochotonae TaxID=2685869 RepID=UPI001407CC7E|nr:hypothetical protein [Nocardioides ochotonae]
MRTVAAALALTVAAGLSFAGTAAATSAEPLARKAPAYGVTASVSGQAIVGQKVTIAGKVTGPGAAGSPVTVQVRHTTGGWKKAATVRTNARSAYTAKIALTKAGRTSVRVLKPRSAQRSAGTSKPVVLTVQKWIDLTRAPHLAVAAGFANHSATIAGTRYASTLQSAGYGIYAFGTGGSCSRLELHLGFLDADRTRLTNDASMELGVIGLTSLHDTGTPPVDFRAGIGAAKRVAVDLSGANAVLMMVEVNGLAEDADSAPSVRAVLAQPRVLCATESLPAIEKGELLYEAF